MRRRAVRWLRRLALVCVAAFATLLVGSAVNSQRGPALRPWHTFVPDDLRAAEIDRLDWAEYLAAEDKLFDAVRRNVTEQLDDDARSLDNRYFAGSPLYPGRFSQDWNRSYVLEPAGPVRGAVVLLHGLTDAPYSLRHVARRYAAAGFVAIGPRAPAHGTVPAALTETAWEDWAAATRLAMREARRRAGPDGTLHIVGYSNGGALALKHALDAIEDPLLPRPDALVLLSPMVGVTAFARFAGLAALPAWLPAFAKAAWFSVIPEFNPFKYNSFPVNAARQAHRLTVALQQQLQRLGRDERLGPLAPVLTFQSVVDFTVSSQAVVTALYGELPANGSELVLFDRNRNTKLGGLLRPAFATSLERLVPGAPRNWRLTVITNAGASDAEMVEQVAPAGSVVPRERRMGLFYPREVYSLSHIALPFPARDSLYGSQPDPEEDFGVNLGAIAARGEVGMLVVSLESLVRMSWNPFYDYMQERIDETIAAPARR